MSDHNEGMLGDLIPGSAKKAEAVQTISSIATFMVLGYSKKEVAEMISISENDLTNILATNADLFKKEFEKNRSLLMVNLESKVFKRIDEILSYETDQGSCTDLLKEQVKVINGVMNLICKLQEKKVNVKTEHKATRVVVDFVGMTTEEKKKALAEIRSRESNQNEE